MRFVSVSEDYGYHRDHYPEIATRIDLEMAMAEVACLFARFGFQLQTEEHYREAEFVQKLALRLQPNQYFTTLPLAATYHETGRHDDALPLFREGLHRFQDFENNTNAIAPALSPAKCLAPDVEIRNLRNHYKKMYEACVRAMAGKSLSGFYVLISLEGLF